MKLSVTSDVARGGARGPGPPLAICLAPSGKIQTELAEVVILYYLALWKFRLVQWQIPANPNGLLFRSLPAIARTTDSALPVCMHAQPNDYV